MQTDPDIVGLLIENWGPNSYILRGSYSGLTIPTTASKFCTGCEIINTTNGKIYRNTGTTALPVWDEVDKTSTNSEIGENYVQYATKTITSAQLLALYTTAIELVAAPGAGKFLEFISATLHNVYGTVVYTLTSATNLSINYTDKSGVVASTVVAIAGLSDQSTDKYAVLKSVATGFGASDAVYNANLVLKLAGANPTVGDGTLTVNVSYRVHTL